ncbi:MAG: HAD family hydrolase [Dehalococcoidia bacterium]
MKIKAVLFDLYGTLVGFEPSRFVIQSQVAKKYDLFLTEAGVSKGYFLADKFMAEQNAVNPIRSMSIVEKEEFFARYEQLVLSGDELEVELSLCKKIFKELQNIPYSMVLYHDVIPTLNALRELNFKLGLISNMDKLGSEILDEFNLSSYVDVCVTSKEAKVEKPNSKIFDLALSKLNVDARSSIYIGDQILSDIEGAKNSKMLPILIDRESSHTDYKGQKITDLSQLIDLLFTKYN